MRAIDSSHEPAIRQQLRTDFSTGLGEIFALERQSRFAVRATSLSSHAHLAALRPALTHWTTAAACRTMVGEVRRTLMRQIAFALLAASLSTAALAEPLPAPLGEPALVIGGSVAKPNRDGEVALDLATIATLGESTIETTTDWEWHEGVQHFAGVPLLDVLDAAGATGDTITVTAIDEYAQTMSRADLEKYGALLATSLNGDTLTDISFGPLWLIFPFDRMADADEREAYTDRAVWSVVRIDVE